MGRMIQFPYGLADFRRIRQQGRVYVDRTAYIRQVETLGDVLVFLRPRRFGKSLWLRTLANYYDLRREAEWGELFGDLAINRDEGPTDFKNRYFVLHWNFSVVDPSGGVAEIAESLRRHVLSRAESFLSDYEGHLNVSIRPDAEPAEILDRLLSAIRKTPYTLYLLIDEYDNFVNEAMASNVAIYQDLLDKDGPFKLLFKTVKEATEGEGLERVFVTGVSPVALNDLTSGFNNAEDISREPALASLCGFREKEIGDLLSLVAAERGLSANEVVRTIDIMRTWYNGYRFSEDSDELVYNPTNVLYFLKRFYRHGHPPKQLQDENLRTDRSKLAFLARTATGAGVIEDLTEGGGEISVARLAASFSVKDLTARIGKDADVVASLLFYMGLLTLTDDSTRLKIPNLVVRRLFLDRLLEIFLTEGGDPSEARKIALGFFRDGNLPPVLDFFERKLLPALSNRDRGAAARKAGQSGSGVNEMVIKALFLSMLFDDTRYVTYSELEIERGYADLCLLVRGERRQEGLFDLLFEFKLVRRKELGKMKGRELCDLDEDALRLLPAVRKALSEARAQARRYRAELVKRHGESGLDPRGYVVVAVGLERMVGEEI